MMNEPQLRLHIISCVGRQKMQCAAAGTATGAGGENLVNLTARHHTHAHYSFTHDT